MPSLPLLQTLAAFDSGKDFVDHISDTDVNAHATPVGEVKQGHLGAALFVCPQPECTVEHLPCSRHPGVQLHGARLFVQDNRCTGLTRCTISSYQVPSLKHLR